MDNEEKQDKSPQKALSRLERFGLVSGLVGLVTDGLALSTFLAGLWGLDVEESPSPGLTLFYILSCLLIFYSWLALSWILTRRGLNFIPEKKRRKNLDKLTTQGVGGVSLGILPLFIVWLVAVGVDDLGIIMTILFFPFPFVWLCVFVSVRYLSGSFYRDLADY